MLVLAWHMPYAMPVLAWPLRAHHDMNCGQANKVMQQPFLRIYPLYPCSSLPLPLLTNATSMLLASLGCL